MSSARARAGDPTPARPPGSSVGRSSRRPVVLAPALLLVDRMRANARQLTVAAVIMVPGLASTWLYASAMSAQVDFAHHELAGTEVVRPAVAALTVSASGAEPDLGDLRSAVGGHPELGLDDELAAVEAGADPAARSAALAALVVSAGDTSQLILDPDLDSFYVMDAQMVQLPRLLIAVSVPAAGAESQTPAQQRAVEAGLLTSAADTIDADLATATTETAGLAPRLEGLARTADAARAVAEQLTASDAAVDTTALTDTANEAVDPAATALTGLLEDRAGGLAGRRDVSLGLTAFGFLLASWFGAATWWRNRHDVGLTLDAMSAIAEGDLDARPLPEGRDELGDIARSLEVTRQLLVGQRADLAASFTEREKQLQTSFAAQRAAELQVRQRAQSIIDETSASVADDLRRLGTQVESVRNAATEIEQRVAAADEVTRAVVEEARTADQGTVSLGESLRGVAGMAELINSVADQTKLLALNAAIEAARAGTAGLGFNVVAEEVKSLAATTAESAQEIAATIAALEADAGHVGAAIGSVGSTIGRLDEATASLRGVAADQFGVVAHLDQALASTIERIGAMATLTERLERRDDERHPAIGTATVELRGHSHLVAVHDLSLSGIRCTSDAPVPLEPGTAAEVTVNVGGLTFRARASGVRTEPGDPIDLGLAFDDLAAGSRATLERMLAGLD